MAWCLLRHRNKFTVPLQWSGATVRPILSVQADVAVTLQTVRGVRLESRPSYELSSDIPDFTQSLQVTVGVKVKKSLFISKQ
jgi:hypothetical protein